MNKHVNITVSGRVQGVWFRASTEQKALELALTGFVQNQPNGNVYIEAEGSEEALDKLVNWCQNGPLLARVDQVIVEGAPLVGYEGFEQRR